MPGTVLAVGIVLGSATLAAGYLAVAQATVAGQRVAAAADAAALAAADTVLGAARGDPCDRAGDIAALQGATLASCDLADAIVTVAVDLTAGPLRIGATARAGPPPS